MVATTPRIAHLIDRLRAGIPDFWTCRAATGRPGFPNPCLCHSKAASPRQGPMRIDTTCVQGSEGRSTYSFTPTAPRRRIIAAAALTLAVLSATTAFARSGGDKSDGDQPYPAATPKAVVDVTGRIFPAAV